MLFTQIILKFKDSNFLSIDDKLKQNLIVDIKYYPIQCIQYKLILIRLLHLI